MPALGEAGAGAGGPLAGAARTSTPFHGHLRLVAAARPDGVTFLARQSFRAPFHISKPYWDGRTLTVQAINPTAGILAGDALELDVRVEAGAVLRVTTPAATRAFMMKDGGARCLQRLAVAPGGALDFTPDPLCPHAGSAYVQDTRLDVGRAAHAFLSETLAPGRIGRGETWAWRRLTLALEVRFEGEPVLREVLDAGGAAMARAAAFHGTPNGWFVNAIVLSPALPEEGAFWSHLRSLHADDCPVGVTRLRRAGWILRAIAPSGQAARDLLAEVRRRLAGHLPMLRSEFRRV